MFLSMKPVKDPISGSCIVINHNIKSFCFSYVCVMIVNTHHYHASEHIVGFLVLPLIDVPKRTPKLSIALHLDPKQVLCRKKLSKPRGSKTPSAIMVGRLP